MHIRKRKFYKDTSLPKDGSDLVMDYDMGDLIQEVRSYRNATEELEFEDITSRQQSDRQQDDIDEWLSSKKSSRRPSDSGNYISNRQLYDSEINGTDISYSDRNRNTHSNTNINKRTDKDIHHDYRTGIEQLSQIKQEKGPVKPFKSRAEEVKYQFSEKKRQEEIRKFTRQRQQENRIQRQKDEDRRRTEELKKLFDLDDGDDYRDSLIEEDLRNLRSTNGLGRNNTTRKEASNKDRSGNYDLDEDYLTNDSFRKENYKDDTDSNSRKTRDIVKRDNADHRHDEENINVRISKTYDDDEEDFIDAGGFDPSKIKSGGAKMQEMQHHSHSHHYHHSHSGKGKALRIIRNAVLISMAVVIGFAGIGYGAYKLMDYTGGLSLYQRTKEQAPDLSQAPLYEQVTIDDDQMPLSASAWQPGWIRYDGKTYAYNTNLLTFLVLGIDSMDEVHEAEDGLSGGQSDAMFFLVLDPDNKDIKIIAINRNTMTDIDVYNEEGVYVGTGEAQICLQHGFGDGLEESCVRTVKTVKNLFHELPINGYISINMGAIPTVNDTVGGVTLKVKYDLPAAGQYRSLRKGDTVTLSGDDAYWYTQHRDINDDFSANERLERQLQYLIEFIPSLQERVKEDPKSIASVYNALSPYMVTDIGLNEAVYLGNEAAQYSFDSANIYQMKGESIIGRSGFEEFIYDEDGLYDLIIDVFYTEVDA
ncbi:LCP family protein [Butyrivibrio fibrisolvens]|uniref:LCP family glycopolymer transferase n=1 Tax=Butyrivibrio fibrisolvens TaxID=831 RepID=UPI0003B71B0D|nr:LCP family protein [Butyrivibrio fibrisolvens]